MGILGIEAPIRSFGDRGATPAPCKQLAPRTFGELVILPIRFHGSQPQVAEFVGRDIPYLAFRDPSAGRDISIGHDGKMAVSTVATKI